MSARPIQQKAIEYRRAQVSKMNLRGWSLAEIAAHMQVTVRTISRDLQAVREAWQKSQLNFAEAQETELRKLAHLEREAWEGWQRSLQPIETNKVSGSGPDLKENRRGERTTKNSNGDVRFLSTVAKCIDKRCQILGVGVLPTINSTIVVQTTEIRQALLNDDQFLEYCRHRACHGDAGVLRLFDATAPLGDVPAPGPAGPLVDGPGQG
jgi:hypothetical protein